MKQKILVCVVAAVLSMGFFPSQAQTTVSSGPVGFVNLTVAGGLTNSRRPTYLSFPLLQSPSITGSVSGKISSLGSNRITLSNAGWVPGALSRPDQPHAVLITSGNASGRIFLIASSSNNLAGSQGNAASANTSNTITISTWDTFGGLNLSNNGLAVNDSFQIIRVDTIGRIFGYTDAVTALGVRAGSNTTNGDSITIVINNSSNVVTETYFYKTNSNPSLNSWVKSTFGNPSVSNTPILPYSGITYNRMGTNRIFLQAIGSVPVNPRLNLIRNTGTTTFAQFWPSDTRIQDLGFQNLPGWLPGATGDTIGLTVNGVAETYFFDRTNWRKTTFGNAIVNTNLVSAGSMILINKKGSNPGVVTYSTNPPYSLGN